MMFVEEEYTLCRTLRCGAAYSGKKDFFLMHWVSPEDKILL
jgi:hypothetical protein